MYTTVEKFGVSKIFECLFYAHQGIHKKYSKNYN